MHPILDAVRGRMVKEVLMITLNTAVAIALRRRYHNIGDLSSRPKSPRTLHRQRYPGKHTQSWWQDTCPVYASAYQRTGSMYGEVLRWHFRQLASASPYRLVSGLERRALPSVSWHALLCSTMSLDEIDQAKDAFQYVDRVPRYFLITQCKATEERFHLPTRDEARQTSCEWVRGRLFLQSEV